MPDAAVVGNHDNSDSTCRTSSYFLDWTPPSTANLLIFVGQACACSGKWANQPSATWTGGGTITALQNIATGWSNKATMFYAYSASGFSAGRFTINWGGNTARSSTQIIAISGAHPQDHFRTYGTGTLTVSLSGVQGSDLVIVSVASCTTATWSSLSGQTFIHSAEGSGYARYEANWEMGENTPGFTGTSAPAGAVAIRGFYQAGGATWVFSQMQKFYDELKRGLMLPQELQKRYGEVFI